MKAKSYQFVIYTCLALGTLCIVSSLLKTWVAVPNSFDWFALGIGVVLCGLSLFRRVAFGPKGFEAEIKQLRFDVQALKLSLTAERQ